VGYFFFSDIGINSFPSRFSQDDAVFVLFRLRGLRKNDASDGLIENSLKTSLGQSGALKVLVCTNLLSQLVALVVTDRCLAHGLKPVDGIRVITQVKLCANEDKWNVGSVVCNLRSPLGLDVLKRRWTDDGKANKEDIRLRVAERPQAIVILLTSSIPKSQVNGLTVNHNVCTVVIEHCRDVLAREGIGGV